MSNIRVRASELQVYQIAKERAASLPHCEFCAASKHACKLKIHEHELRVWKLPICVAGLIKLI